MSSGSCWLWTSSTCGHISLLSAFIFMHISFSVSYKDTVLEFGTPVGHTHDEHISRSLILSAKVPFPNTVAFIGSGV